jgi:hypothetical protein
MNTNQINRSIILLRGEYVILSRQLAKIYGVDVRALHQTVKRNSGLFTNGAIFQLTKEEFRDLQMNGDIAPTFWGGSRRALPYAFTKHAITMLQYLSIIKKRESDVLHASISRAFKAKTSLGLK